MAAHRSQRLNALRLLKGMLDASIIFEPEGDEAPCSQQIAVQALTAGMLSHIAVSLKLLPGATATRTADEAAEELHKAVQGMHFFVKMLPLWQVRYFLPGFIPALHDCSAICSSG